MILAIVAIVVGLVLLVWSADRFVDGAVGVAQFFGMSTFLIGMIIVGFGTSAPEMGKEGEKRKKRAEKKGEENTRGREREDRKSVV